jgi:hypothetical protein
MKRTRPHILLLTALAVLSFSAMADTELNSSEIRQLFSGNTPDAYSELKKVSVSLFYDNNGEVRGKFSNGKIGATKWWVKDIGQIYLKVKVGDLCFVVVERDGRYQKHLIKGDEHILAFSAETFSAGNVNHY